MEVTINGKPQQLGEGSSVADLVSDLGFGDTSRGVAVALDGEVLRRSAWGECILVGGERLEVLRAVAGG
jgi:sulfur carrier protein